VRRVLLIDVEAAPGLPAERPDATIRSWIVVGRQRGSPKDCLQNDFATAKFTSSDHGHQLERAHTKPGAEPDDAIDLVVRSDALPNIRSDSRRTA